MKEIIYQSTVIVEVVEERRYKGVKYAIINFGEYPVAMVEDISGSKDFDDEILDDVEVHGGFSYRNIAFWKKDMRTMYLGWQYNLPHDYNGKQEGEPDKYVNKKWTYEEILAEVHSVIEQLLEIRRK